MMTRPLICYMNKILRDFDIHTEVNMNSKVLWDVTTCSVVYTSTFMVETSVYNHQPSLRRIPKDGFQVIFDYSNLNGTYETLQLSLSLPDAASVFSHMVAHQDAARATK